MYPHSIFVLVNGAIPEPSVTRLSVEAGQDNGIILGVRVRQQDILSQSNPSNQVPYTKQDGFDVDGDDSLESEGPNDRIAGPGEDDPPL